MYMGHLYVGHVNNLT